MTQPDAERAETDLPRPDQRRWVEDVTGRRITAVQREHAGGSRQLWYVSLDGPAGTDLGPDVVLRVDSGRGALAGSPYTLRREAVAYGALGGTAVPVPRLVAATDDALLLERVTGSSRLDGLDDDDAAAVLSEFMGAIGALHRLDPAALDLAGMGSPSTTLEAVRSELASWRHLAARASAVPDPLVEYALAWLDGAAPGLPRAGEPPVLVQGDTGPGNAVVDGRMLTGLVDWELSHLGDPMDDVAWIDLRCRPLAGPFGDTAWRDRCYEASSAFAIDPVSLAFHAVMVRLRCAVTTARTLTVGGGALGLVVYAPPHHRFREELALALLAASGAEATAGEQVEPTQSALAAIDDDAIAGLRDVVLPAATTPQVKLRARAALLALEHHRAVEQLGPALQRAEDADRRATLGRAVDDEDLAAVAARAGAESDVEVLGLLHRSARRARTCWDVPAARLGPALAPPRRAADPARATRAAVSTEQANTGQANSEQANSERATTSARDEVSRHG